MNAHGPLPPAFAPVARALAAGYWLGLRLHAAALSFRPPRRAPVPVVSVGNVSVGGTGKTPFVRWCVQALASAGLHPAIALRGYRARDGLSDEAEEFRAMLPGIPVAVGADRLAALARARSAGKAFDCAVLDDGFQHRSLARDLDIVLVDATRPAIDGPLLPAGWLREPADALRRADLVVVTRARAVDDALAGRIASLSGRPPRAWAAHEWTRIERTGAGGRDMPIEALRGTRVVAATALANPAAFVADAEAHGARVVADLRFRDHHAYSAADASRIAATARSKDAAVLCTGKDWAKLRPLVGDGGGTEWLVVRAGIRFLAGEADVRAALLAACGRDNPGPRTS